MMAAKFTLLLLLAPQLLAGWQAFAQEGSTLTVTDFKLTISAADGSAITEAPATYPAKALSNPQLAPAHTLEVTFTPNKDGQAFKPQQVMLVLTSQASSASAYAIGKAKKDGSYAIAITVAAVEKQLGKQDGKFTATLLVGDSSAAKSLSWALGDLELISSPAAGVPPQQAVRTASFQPLNVIKPEIAHIFRAPDKRAPPTLSLAFTGAVVVPLVVAVLVVLGGLKVNFKGWPADATTQLAALVFHGSLAAMLGLYLLFWLKLNLAQTLPLAAGLGAVVALSGYWALAGIAAGRVKRD